MAFLDENGLEILVAQLKNAIDTKIVAENKNNEEKYLKKTEVDKINSSSKADAGLNYLETKLMQGRTLVNISTIKNIKTNDVAYVATTKPMLVGQTYTISFIINEETECKNGIACKINYKDGTSEILLESDLTTKKGMHIMKIEITKEVEVENGIEIHSKDKKFISLNEIFVLENDQTKKPYPSYFAGVANVGEGSKEISVSSIWTEGNLFNGEVEQGTFADANGILYPSQPNRCVNKDKFILVTKETLFIDTHSDYKVGDIYCYDENKKYLGVVFCNNSKTEINIKPKTKFINFNIKSNNLNDNFKPSDVNKNIYIGVNLDSNLEYREDKKTISIKYNENKNEIKVVDIDANKINFDTSILYSGGSETSTSDWCVTQQYIKVSKGVTYEIQRGTSQSNTSSNQGYIYAYKYDKDKYYQNARFDIGTASSFTSDIDGYIRLCMKLNSIGNFKILYNGSDHIKGVWTPLKILREWDTIEKNLDGSYKYIYRSGQRKLDGSEGDKWTLEKTNSNTITFKLVDLFTDAMSSSEIICDRFNNIQEDGDNEKISKIGSNGEVYITIDKSKLETGDLEGFKKWLKENPATIVYKLDKEEVCECTLNDLLIFSKEKNYRVESGLIEPTTILKVYSSKDDIIGFIQGKISNVENNMQQVLLSGSNVKTKLVDKLTSNGTQASTDETFDDLIRKITIGRKWAKGIATTTKFTANEKQRTIITLNGLDFRPNIFISISFDGSGMSAVGVLVKDLTIKDNKTIIQLSKIGYDTSYGFEYVTNDKSDNYYITENAMRLPVENADYSYNKIQWFAFE